MSRMDTHAQACSVYEICEDVPICTMGACSEADPQGVIVMNEKTSASTPPGEQGVFEAELARGAELMRADAESERAEQ